jgi:16S rRNA (cytosine967-C5)-methyltransferase
MNDIKRALLSEELTIAAQILSQFCEGADLEKTFDSVLKSPFSIHQNSNQNTRPNSQLNVRPNPRLNVKLRASSGKISSPAVKEFVYRAIRSLKLLQAITGILNTKLPSPWVLALQQLVIAQLLHMQDNVGETASTARMVDQAIEAVKANTEHAFAAGFVNATLRRFLREKAQLLAQATKANEAKFNYPQWWLNELEKNYPSEWHELAQAGDTQAPFCLRINQRFGTAAQYCVEFAAAYPQHQCRPITSLLGVQAVIVSPAMPVKDLLGFSQGHVSVQDAGAQMAALLLELKDGQNVLDACAAPGGKAIHCLELANVRMTALDVSAERLSRVAENLSRFRAGMGTANTDCQLKVGDARLPSQWWDGQLFDRILADVPCSASGIVRRHPDIRWRRQRGDLATFSLQQLEILNGLWPLLKPGGKLLYVTCSLFAAEGQEVISQFLQGRRNATQEPLIGFNPGLTNFRNGYLLPKTLQDPQTHETVAAEHDGFFYARLVKTL